MRYDAMNEHYTEIRLFGKPALFNDMRLDQATVRKDYIYMKSDMMMKHGNQSRLRKAF